MTLFPVHYIKLRSQMRHDICQSRVKIPLKIILSLEFDVSWRSTMFVRVFLRKNVQVCKLRPKYHVLSDFDTDWQDKIFMMIAMHQQESTS